MNNVILIGNLTKDVELKYLPGNGTAVATFTIAVKRSYVKNEEDQQADFIFINTFGKTAENCAKYIGKGSKVAINGELRIDQYEENGQHKSFTKVNANRVEFLNAKKEDTEASSDSPIPEFQKIDDEDIPF